MFCIGWRKEKSIYILSPSQTKLFCDRINATIKPESNEIKSRLKLTVQTQGLGENKDQNHTDEKLLLLSDRSDASVTDNADCHTRGKSGQPAAEAGGQVRKSRVQAVLAEPVLRRDDGSLNDDRHDKPVNSQHTRHDHWDDIPHDEPGVHHSHGRDPNARLGRPVSRSDVGEDERRGDAHESEERRRGRACFHLNRTHGLKGGCESKR
ncbi:hypothetical protein THAOC_33974 [Thalassiosira oceanica]|uniref:Uncharacterized protein n=1 Tax=Thalassiosira oceanica TaxID=159749 RepID=K0RKX0_THAOC|nr:hypothetical protein THAOC_33974 [Thalassiosira oceanica]|eukprot:EJK47312.1 hypothetical protein THAOC_33974 [Thalassiosira oceanica]